MFESLKSLIDSRLGKDIVHDDFVFDNDFFIKISDRQLYSVAFFLKNDPDVRLTLLDQIIALPSSVLPWKNPINHPAVSYQLIYQLKSLKLPYRVSLVIDVDTELPLTSLYPLYAGTRFFEVDLAARLGCSFEEKDKR